MALDSAPVSSNSLEALQAFFQTSPAVRQATRSLSRDAEVALVLDGDIHARFSMASGEPRVETDAATQPDFTLFLPDAAVARITGLQSDDVGEFGIEFFKLAMSRDTGTRVRIRIDAPTLRILGHGYLGVLATGGMKVTGWLLRNGVRNPKAAIDRLRGVGQR
jgi:hypothetical protein